MAAREIRNGEIKSTMLGFEDHGFLTWMVHVTGDGWGQGFGGYMIDGPAMEATVRGLLKTFNVDTWEHLSGLYCRLDSEHTKAHRIGHLIEDRWFDPAAAYEEIKESS